MVKDIGNRIAELRRERGLNQDELAELATLSRISIARYETGKIEPGAKALGRIADALEVSTDVLLGRSDKPPDIAPKTEAPKTEEAQIISAGVDKMPPENRKIALNLLKTVYSDYFENEQEVDKIS